MPHTTLMPQTHAFHRIRHPPRKREITLMLVTHSHYLKPANNISKKQAPTFQNKKHDIYQT